VGAARGIRLRLVLSALGAVACARAARTVPALEAAPPCTFTNPVASGADPWVVRHDSMYYYVRSKDRRIWIAASPRLYDALTAPAIPIWSAPDTGWNRTNIWAPELHFLDGRWYVYYAAGRAGPPFTNQHAGVLESADADPMGRWADRGRLYTGDSVETGRADRWSIDLTVGRIGGRAYAIWSGWAADAATDKTPQQLYIAPMASPWRIAANRVPLSAPDAAWERGPELDLQEGPELLAHEDGVFVIYSTRDSWLKEYTLGQLRLRDTSANPLDPANWSKSGPVFAGNDRVFGVGHASFVSSTDTTEHWIVYHSKDSATPGWIRSVWMQPFTWASDGAPNFGEPIGPRVPVALPRGECPSR
jgi:GH43 family beta-xylosidase